MTDERNLFDQLWDCQGSTRIVRVDATVESLLNPPVYGGAQSSDQQGQQALEGVKGPGPGEPQAEHAPGDRLSKDLFGTPSLLFPSPRHHNDHDDRRSFPLT